MQASNQPLSPASKTLSKFLVKIPKITVVKSEGIIDGLLGEGRESKVQYMACEIYSTYEAGICRTL